MAKHKKHDKIVKDYETQKAEHLAKLATKLIKSSDQNDKLREKKLNIEKIYKMLKNDEI